MSYFYKLKTLSNEKENFVSSVLALTTILCSFTLNTKFTNANEALGIVSISASNNFPSTAINPKMGFISGWKIWSWQIWSDVASAAKAVVAVVNIAKAAEYVVDKVKGRISAPNAINTGYSGDQIDLVALQKIQIQSLLSDLDD